MTHHFEVEVAKKYGVNAAVILDMLRFWVAHNAANKKNLKEGRTWTYNSNRAWADLLPYLSEKQVRTAIDVLVSAGLVVKANFNESGYNRTLWYALTDETICPIGQIDPPALADPTATAGKSLIQLDQPVTDLTPPATPSEFAFADKQIAGEAFVGWFLVLLTKTGAPEPKMTPTIRALWIDTFDKLIRIDGKSKAQIWKACEWARNDNFWRTNFYAPTKLRERKDGVLRIDQFLSRLATPQHATSPKSSSRSFSTSAVSELAALDAQLAAGT